MLALLVSVGGAAGKDVARSATSNMAHGRGLLPGISTSVLLIEGQSGPLRSSMSVACSSSATVEPAGGLGSRDGMSGNTRRGSCVGRSTEHVAGTAPSRVHVAVLGDGRVWLGDGVGSHCEICNTLQFLCDGAVFDIDVDIRWSVVWSVVWRSCYDWQQDIYRV